MSVPAIATPTSLGEIALNGDFIGLGDNPQLVKSGVVAGAYTPLRACSVDSKGRITSAGELTYASDILPLLSAASTTAQGIFSLGNGLSINAGSVFIDESQNLATAINLGFVKVGSNLNISSGVISAPVATSSVLGVASFGSDFTVSSGAVSFDYSVVSLNLTYATPSVFGVVKVGSNLNISSGVISAPVATSSVLGVASFNSSDFTVSSGAVSLLNTARKNTQNTFTKCQAGTSEVITGASSYTPDFQDGAAIVDVTLSSNLTINFPTVFAPAGCVVTRTINIRYDSGTPYSVSLSGSYLTNSTLNFTNEASSGVDVLTLICTSSTCFAILNNNFQ